MGTSVEFFVERWTDEATYDLTFKGDLVEHSKGRSIVVKCKGWFITETGKIDCEIGPNGVTFSSRPNNFEVNYETLDIITRARLRRDKLQRRYN